MTAAPPTNPATEDGGASDNPAAGTAAPLTTPLRAEDGDGGAPRYWQHTEIGAFGTIWPCGWPPAGGHEPITEPHVTS